MSRPVIFVLFFIMVFMYGCGKKGPPVLVESRPQPAADLRAVVEKEAVRLSWTVPEGNTGFIIYRMKKTGGKCSKCPPKYQRLDNVTVNGRKMTYLDKSGQSGVYYIYTVAGYSRNGSSGGDSNTVEVFY